MRHAAVLPCVIHGSLQTHTVYMPPLRQSCYSINLEHLGSRGIIQSSGITPGHEDARINKVDYTLPLPVGPYLWVV
jgi:hypothetical protein